MFDSQLDSHTHTRQWTILGIRGLIAQEFIHPPNRLPLHIRQDMAVQVKGDADLAVAQALAGDFRMNPVDQKVGGVRVPQVMEPKPGEGVFAMVRAQCCEM